MRGSRPLLMTALVSLFLAEGQRAFFASLFALGYDAAFPSFRPLPAVVALVFLLVLLAPSLPLARWLDRRAAVALAAVAVAVGRLPMTHPAFEARLLGGALVVAGAATFLTWAVGYLERRAMAGGVVLGLVVDQLLRLAGSSYDLSLRLSWLPVQAVLSLALVVMVVLWARGGEKESGARSLERRAGGLRVRGAAALGALLFMDLHVLGLPPIVAGWTGVEHTFAGLAVAVAGAAALGATLLFRRPTGGRGATLALVALVVAGALLGYGTAGTAVALTMAAGHLAALLLITRALDPASGRRSGVAVSAGFVVFALATALYDLTFLPELGVAALEGVAPWLFGAVGLFLAASFALLPRPAAMEPPASRVPAGVLAAAIVPISLLLASLSAGPGADSTVPARAEEGVVRVSAWTLPQGFARDRRFDPVSLAETLRHADVDVVALHGVRVGAPTSYGVDLPVWLARRTELRPHRPGAAGPVGTVFLSRLRDARLSTSAVPGGTDGRLLRLAGSVGGEAVTFGAWVQGDEERPRPERVREALAALPPGPAVVLVDGAAGDNVAWGLADAGFHAVARDASGIDRIWVRGLRSDPAGDPVVSGSPRSPVVTTLHILDRRIRSTERQ